MYVVELASDALQVIPQALAGYQKSVSLLMRSLIESLMRHVYFSDHPVEYARAHRNTEWHVPIRDLIEYLFHLPRLEDLRKKFDAPVHVKDLYAGLSTRVHAARVDRMEMRSALASIAFDESVFAKQVESFAKCTEVANFVLSAFHTDRVRRFPPAHRQIIVNTIGTQGRRALSGV